MASEDHNIPLEARIELLEKIKIQLGHLKVLPEFWAVCQFADLERLRDLCKVDRAGLEIFQYNAAQITAQCLFSSAVPSLRLQPPANSFVREPVNAERPALQVP